MASARRIAEKDEMRRFRERCIADTAVLLDVYEEETGRRDPRSFAELRRVLKERVCGALAQGDDDG